MVLPPPLVLGAQFVLAAYQWLGMPDGDIDQEVADWFQLVWDRAHECYLDFLATARQAREAERRQKREEELERRRQEAEQMAFDWAAYDEDDTATGTSRVR